MQRIQIEKNRRLTAEEEHELLELNGNRKDAPNMHCTAALENPPAAAQAFEAGGLLRVNELLSHEEAAALREYVDATLQESIESVGTTETPFLQLFGPVMGREHRYDVLLPMDSIVHSALQRILGQVAPLLMELVGAKASVCELSALVSDPGSAPQPLHHDTGLFGGSRRRVSMLLALQDVEEDMGPTVLFPGTNTPDWHIDYMARGEELEELLEGEGGSESSFVLGLLNAGDAMVYDTNLLHCGGANCSHTRSGGGERRTLLVVSSQVEDETNSADHTNIRPSYRGKFALSQHSEWMLDK
jgi:ectoine hydroxylase-related dioxygenase (phytanoyl-CoA dioxygenase family)